MYKPDKYYKHVSDINLLSLKQEGIKLIAFDLDNTLDEPDRMTISIIKEIDQFLDDVEAYKFEILILSNNSIQGRVKSFADIRGYNYIEWARKPFQKNYKASEIITKYDPKEVCFVGDKVVTDVIGGKRYGGSTILVDPLCPKAKHWYSKIMKASEIVFNAIVGFKRGNYYE